MGNPRKIVGSFGNLKLPTCILWCCHSNAQWL